MKLRWGILGVAQINDRILPSFPRARNAELRAIASRSLDKAKAAAQAAGIPVAHGSYEALLDDPMIDAVYNPLPNSLHTEWTRKAAQRGKHVLCEKPLCPTAAEAQALIDFCKARGVKLMDGFMWPHHPRTHRLRRFLDSGGIGEVRRVSGAFTFPMKPLDPNNIRLKPELAGGSLLDVGCYPVYGIRWAFGVEPVKVYATATYHNGVDVEMNGILWLADGRMATFDCGFTLPFRRWMEITGTDGVVLVPDLWVPVSAKAVFHVIREGHEPEEIAIDGEDQIQHMIEDFSRAVLEDQPVTPSPEEAVKTLRVLDALAKSAQTVDPVQLPAQHGTS
jgi:predicted dehydrogenase